MYVQSNHPRIWPSRALIVVLTAALLLMSACATGDEADGDEATTPVEQESAAAANEAAGAPATESPEAEGAGGDPLSGIDLAADYCTITQQANESGMFAGEMPTTREELETATAQAEQVFDALVREAPDEIAEDVRIAADAVITQMTVMREAAEATGQVSPADPEVAAQLQELESDRVEAALDAVSEWEAENC